ARSEVGEETGSGEPPPARARPEAGTARSAGRLPTSPAAGPPPPAPRRYLSLLERAAAAVDIPVIASLNGVTTGGWTDYASALEQAGAPPLQPKNYPLPAPPPTPRPGAGPRALQRPPPPQDGGGRPVP